MRIYSSKAERKIPTYEKKETGEWCSKHRSSSRNSQECFSKGLEKSSHDKMTERNKSFKNYMIRVPVNVERMPILLGTSGEEEIKILLDTEAKNNYISKRTAQELSLKMEVCKIISRAIYGNGISSAVLETVKFQLSFQGNGLLAGLLLHM